MPETILVVDDEPDIRFLLRMALERAGFEVEEAAGGEEALTACEASPPSLVLLDVNMPRLNGFAVVERLRSAPETKDIPVLLISAESTSSNEQRAAEVGAQGYVPKSMPSRDLIERIRRTL